MLGLFFYWNTLMYICYSFYILVGVLFKIGENTIGTMIELGQWYEEQVDQPFDPDQVTTRDLHDWISYMKTVQRLADTTVNQRIGTVKTYWTFLVKAGYSTLNQRN